MQRLDSDLSRKWHSAINELNIAQGNYAAFPYYAKEMADELPRMALLFERERTGQLPTIHRQCSHDEQGTPIPDNHLSCCMGVVCRECPFLKALGEIDAAPEQVDQIKAWTCAAHILSEAHTGAFDTTEGFLLTTDDKMYWSRLYESLASMSEADEDEAGEGESSDNA